MGDSAISELIAGHEVFRGLDPGIIDTLAGFASEREFSKDEVVFRYGEPAKTFYLVRSGTIVVEVAAIEGPPLVLQRLGEGALLGWSWLIPPYRWNFQARAQTPAAHGGAPGDGAHAHDGRVESARLRVNAGARLIPRPA